MTNTPNNDFDSVGPNGFNKEEHLLRFGYSDGFCERLLHIELWVDLDFNFELSYSTFQSETVNKQGILPASIRGGLMELLAGNLSLLKENYYIHEGATDFPVYTWLFNQYGVSREFTIGPFPTTLKDYSGVEQVFFKTLLDLRNFLIEETGYEID